MKKSKVVTLGTVGALATAFAGCGEDDERAYCLDENEQVVDNSECDDDRGGSHVWFFAGGSYVRGQSLRGQSGERIAASNKAALANRGGFGSTGRSTGGSGIGVKTGSSSGGS